jgi:hypothetical protein
LAPKKIKVKKEEEDEDQKNQKKYLADTFTIFDIKAV